MADTEAAIFSHALQIPVMATMGVSPNGRFLHLLKQNWQAFAEAAMTEIQACSTCKTECSANELIMCYICRQGHCKNCPSSCDCTVANYLNMLEVALKLAP
jgi:hypothetical protein